MAWAYTAVFLLGVYGSRAVIWLKHPDLLAERGRAVERRDVRTWDRALLLLISLVGPILIMVVAGLDDRTKLEEATLREGLPGYAEYVSRVRYRLLPGVW